MYHLVCVFLLLIDERAQGFLGPKAIPGYSHRSSWRPAAPRRVILSSTSVKQKQQSPAVLPRRSLPTQNANPNPTDDEKIQVLQYKLDSGLKWSEMEQLTGYSMRTMREWAVSWNEGDLNPTMQDQTEQQIYYQAEFEDFERQEYERSMSELPRQSSSPRPTNNQKIQVIQFKADYGTPWRELEVVTGYPRSEMREWARRWNAGRLTYEYEEGDYGYEEGGEEGAEEDDTEGQPSLGLPTKADFPAPSTDQKLAVVKFREDNGLRWSEMEKLTGYTKKTMATWADAYNKGKLYETLAEDDDLEATVGKPAQLQQPPVTVVSESSLPTKKAARTPTAAQKQAVIMFKQAGNKKWADMERLTGYSKGEMRKWSEEYEKGLLIDDPALAQPREEEEILFDEPGPKTTVYEIGNVWTDMSAPAVLTDEPQPFFWQEELSDEGAEGPVRRVLIPGREVPEEFQPAWGSVTEAQEAELVNATSGAPSAYLSSSSVRRPSSWRRPRGSTIVSGVRRLRQLEREREAKRRRQVLLSQLNEGKLAERDQSVDVFAEEGVIRPLVRIYDDRTEKEYWVEWKRLPKKTRKRRRQLSRRTEQRLRRELTAPWRQNWSGGLVLGVLVTVVLLKLFPGLLDVVPIEIPDITGTIETSPAS
ncbi:unnamed protein product [Vitrella brassicaformis CCMP3155]|uniref:Chromo domain-containing protein n=1 Tax=Vitrella brassicaformis (strain CCMP3155) TaxID=1169540 RepID=A0A0G4GXQ4_VITBC|nr:unnamed protein product [Vitrella brassicaformis CCMP3155]|eukprot:CEM35889.1 unnamed protein product [Vitrella brassicaformis CCMP3155]